MLERQSRAATVSHSVLEGKLRWHEEAEQQVRWYETETTNILVHMGSDAVRLAAYLDDGSLNFCQLLDDRLVRERF